MNTADQEVMTTYFYDCVMAGLFEVRKSLPSFLERYFSLQSREGLSRNEIARIKGYFGIDGQNAIRPMWLSNSFIAPYIAYLSGRWITLLIQPKSFIMQPHLVPTPSDPFPCRLEGVAVTCKTAEPQGYYYLLGSVIMVTTMELIRGSVSLEAVAAEMMRSLRGPEENE